MADLDLSKAIEAGAQAATDYCAGGWPAQAYEGEVEAAILAALPHILTALAEQAHAEANATVTWSAWRVPGNAESWLNAKAAEAAS
jgi:hypothetical protein